MDSWMVVGRFCGFCGFVVFVMFFLAVCKRRGRAKKKVCEVERVGCFVGSMLRSAMQRASDSIALLETEVEALTSELARLSDKLAVKRDELKHEQRTVREISAQLQDRYFPELERYLPESLCLLIASYDTYTACLDCGHAFPRIFGCLRCLPGSDRYQPRGRVTLKSHRVTFYHKADCTVARYVHQQMQGVKTQKPLLDSLECTNDPGSGVIRYYPAGEVVIEVKRIKTSRQMEMNPPFYDVTVQRT